MKINYFLVVLSLLCPAIARAQLLQMHYNGALYRYTGTPCSGSGCSGWQLLDNNLATWSAVADDSHQFYQLHSSGAIYRYTGIPCSGGGCPGWQLLDKNPATVGICSKNCMWR